MDKENNFAFLGNYPEREVDFVESLLNSSGIPTIRKYPESGGYLDVYMGYSAYGIDIYVPAAKMKEAKNIVLPVEDKLKTDDKNETEERINNKKTDGGNDIMEKEFEISETMRKKILSFQKDEITEYHIYKKLARKTTDKENTKILEQIAEDEHKHYDFWELLTGQKIKPNKIRISWYYFLAVILGLTFSLKLLEKGEEDAQDTYNEIVKKVPEAEKIISDEEEHEHKLLTMIEEERLKYVGSMVLGLNDALVELTGTLAGLTFALKDTTIIAMAGLITGLAASFSMAASEYLSTKSESEHEHAFKSSLYTGGAYIITVFFLILPYLLLTNFMLALVLTIVIAILIIFVFNFYISVAQDLNFKKRFFEMAAISFGVALISFIIGYLIRVVLGVDV